MVLYDSTHERLERVRARARRQKRIALAVLLGVLGLLALGLWRSAPPPPRLIVTWPSPQKYGRRTFESGATVLLRSGNAFTVSVTDAERWNISGDTPNTRIDKSNRARQILWQPTSPSETLRVHCRAVAGGWRSLLARLWPTRTLTLNGTTAASSGGLRYYVHPRPGAPVWLSSQIVATDEAKWDERALPLLEAAAQDLRQAPRRAATTNAASPNATAATPAVSAPIFTHWRLVRSFKETKDSVVPGDTGTYAVAPLAEPLLELPRVAQNLARRRPATSIKIMARLDTEPPRGVLRLAFDTPEADGKNENGKNDNNRNGRKQDDAKDAAAQGARAGWVINAGDKAATPLLWWRQGRDEVDAASALPPAAPGRVRATR